MVCFAEIRDEFLWMVDGRPQTGSENLLVGC